MKMAYYTWLFMQSQPSVHLVQTINLNRRATGATSPAIITYEWELLATCNLPEHYMPAEVQLKSKQERSCCWNNCWIQHRSQGSPECKSSTRQCHDPVTKPTSHLPNTPDINKHLPRPKFNTTNTSLSIICRPTLYKRTS
jgi:hypothetical protein